VESGTHWGDRAFDFKSGGELRRSGLRIHLIFMKIFLLKISSHFNFVDKNELKMVHCQR
jgi:hypothetical protein